MSSTRWLLLPYLLGAFLLVALPVIISFSLSFFSYDGLSPPVWIGWRNFQDVFTEPLFSIALSNSLFFIYLAVPLRLLAALCLALLLNRPRPGVGFFRSAVYFPSLIPDMAFALLWLWLLNPFYGPINQLLNGFGLAAPAWLVNPETAKPALVMMSIFTLGEGFVILLVALKNVPQVYYDAVWIDGGSSWQAFWRLTLPFIRPWIFILLVRDVALTFQSTFIPAYVMTRGGPYYSTLFLPLLSFEEAFDRLRIGPGSVMMLLIFLVTLSLLLLLAGAFQRWSYED